MPLFWWLFGGKWGLLLCLKRLLKVEYLPSLLQWEKVSRRRSDGWGVFYQMYTFFKRSCHISSFDKKQTQSLPLEGKVSTRGSEASEAVDGWGGKGLKFRLYSFITPSATPHHPPPSGAVSLRLGHATALTVHRTVIHYRSAASLPQGEAFQVLC